MAGSGHGSLVKTYASLGILDGTTQNGSERLQNWLKV